VRGGGAVGSDRIAKMSEAITETLEVVLRQWKMIQRRRRGGNLWRSCVETKPRCFKLLGERVMHATSTSNRMSCRSGLRSATLHKPKL